MKTTFLRFHNRLTERCKSLSFHENNKKFDYRGSHEKGGLVSNGRAFAFVGLQVG